MVNSAQKATIKRCQSSVSWFLRNFGKLKHPSAGILPFVPFSYQKRAIKDFRENRFNIFRKCRQSGISKISGAFATWFAMFHPQKTVLIVSRTNDAAMGFLRDHVVFLYEHLPPWMQELWKPTKQNEHEISFPNGSRIQSLTSHPDVLRSHAASLNIIDEAAFIQGMDTLWAGGWSTLQHGGCLHPKSLVSLNTGLSEIGRLHTSDDQWQDISIDLMTDDGVGRATKSYYNGVVETRRLTTSSGHYIEASLSHKFRILTKNGKYDWKEVKDLTIDDELILSCKYCESGADQGLDEHSAKSIGTECGNFNRPVPQSILQSTQKIRQAFLEGYFDADWTAIKDTTILRQIQTMLLLLGTRSAIQNNNLFMLNNDRYENTIAIEEFYNASKGLPSNIRQAILVRKGKNKLPRHFVQSLASEHQQLLNTTLGYLASNDLFTDKLVDIQSSQNATYDITESTKNTYIANGFISHNSCTVISTCVAPNTYIWTENGLCQIKDLEPNKFDGFEGGYYHVNYKGPKVLGINGLEMPSKFYKRPKEATRKLILSGGYHLEASRIHKLPTVDSTTGQIVTRFFADLRVGDILPIKCGQMVFGDKDDINYKDPNRTYTKNPRYFTIDKITPELGYLLGVIVAEGYVREQEVVICCGDKSVIDDCCAWNNLYWRRFERDGVHIASCRKPMLVRFFKHLGLKLIKAPFKEIPARLFSCSEPVIRNFLRGLFDGDGSAAKRCGEVCLTSTSIVLIEQVRQLLFNYGIICYLEIKEAGTTTFKRKNGDIKTYKTHKSYRLVVSGNYTRIFYEKIGFGLNRKQKRLDNKKSHDWSILMPPVVILLLKQLKDSTDLSISKMTKLGLAPNVLFGRNTLTKNRLVKFLDKINYPNNEYYLKLKELINYDDFMEIKEITESESEVYDFTMPQTHTFIGNCTIQMNTSGIGGWYWGTWADAEAGLNGFNPIMVNWWDMDWAIEYMDPISRKHIRIAPRDGIRECKSKEERLKFGPYWSPWLQEQYNQLQEQGEAWKFRQEVLADFVGSGNTILSPESIDYISSIVKDPEQRVTGYQTYVHPVTTNVEQIDFDFAQPDEGLWVWRKPIPAKPEKRRGGEIIEAGQSAHSYVMGVDIATGKGRDYSTIEILDIDEMEQVAEFMAHCLPREFVRYIDRIGRWYNCALAVIERNNGGDTLIDTMRYEINYPRLWRKKEINDKPVAPNSEGRARALKVRPYGFSTSVASKPILNKYLIDCVRDGEGYKIYSKRLLKQIQTYVRKRDRTGRDTGKTEAEEGTGNYDDLVIAFALALVGAADAFMIDAGNLMPFGGSSTFKDASGPVIFSSESVIEAQQQCLERGGVSILMPMTLTPDELLEVSAARQLDAYTLQLGAIPISQGKPSVVPPKFYYERK